MPFSLLERYFEREQVGAYKGDICRYGALHTHGGFYFDVDMLARCSNVRLRHAASGAVADPGTRRTSRDGVLLQA